MSDEKVKGLDEAYCRSCGVIIKKEAEICPKCGVRQKSTEKNYGPDVSEKSRLVAFLLCTFLGAIGVHRFYVGKITSGIMQILFGWATLFIWPLVDWIMILSGSFKDKEGKYIKNWQAD
jgi:TM2 domain-containing membrane protein YozV